MSAGRVEVVALGALCDAVPPEEYGGSPGGASFHVEEFAELSDGRRVALLDDRGWTTWPHGLTLDEWWAQVTVEQITHDVFNVVLPDNAEESGDDHEWRWFVTRLLAVGVDTTPTQLRRLPYRVEIGDRIGERLRAQGQ